MNSCGGNSVLDKKLAISRKIYFSNVRCLNFWFCSTHWRSRYALLWSVWSTFLAKCEMISMDYVCMCSSGPGQYNPSVKSFPPMALISSREDRFKVSVDTNPGPGAYQVNMLLKFYACETFLPPSLHEQPACSNHGFSVGMDVCVLGFSCVSIRLRVRVRWVCVSGVLQERPRLTLSHVLILWESIKFLPLTLRRAEGNWLLCKKNPNFNNFLWFRPISTDATRGRTMQFPAQGSFSLCGRICS